MSRIIPASEYLSIRCANARWLFNTLWSKAKDAPEYDKAQWLALANILSTDGPSLRAGPSYPPVHAK